MAESAGEKSFEATPHRRQEAREQGQVVFSQDLASAAMLMLAVVLLMMLGGAVLEFFAKLIQQQLSEAAEIQASQESLVNAWVHITYAAGMVLLPILGLLMLGGVLVNIFQIGLLWLPDRVAPDFSRVSLFAGVKRIFSLSGTARLGFGVVKVLIVAGVAFGVLWMRWDDVLRSSGLEVAKIGKLLIDIAISTALWVALALLILALFDYGLQRWKHEQDLRMTHQQVRDEMKNQQGDPQLIARRRAVQRQMVMHRISNSVPKADVIITNPTELSIAVQYDPKEMAAPVVVAKGAGVLAQRIRRLALENNIPIVERKPLAQLLYKEVDIGKPIPTDAYAAVAEVLAYVYQLQGKKLPMPPRAA
jgi:flagellar biosynthetic protein FlhB